MLNPHFGGSTNIDVSVLARQAREPGSILMTISDGEIHNWEDIKDSFKRIISNKYYVHFQIGNDSEATSDIRSWGCPVISIADAKDLPRRAIEITKNFYKNYASGEHP